MARQGAFDGLDAAMMVHPAGIDLITMPSLAVNEVRVTYTGKAAHASAMPFAGVNALDALVTAYQSIAQLRQHIKQSERIHGIFNEAGLAPNIVPDHAVGTFYVRAENGLALAELKARVQNCFEAGALAAGCEVQIDWALGDYLEIKDSWAIAERYKQNAESLGRDFFPLENAEQRCRFDRYGQYQPSRAVHSPDDCLCAAKRGDSQSGICQMGRFGKRRQGGD